MTAAEQIDELIRETGAPDPRTAVALKAQEMLAQQRDLFGESDRPPNLDVLASLQGIRRSEERPVFSPDAELVPDTNGGVSMRVNPDRPETRQRFSVAHEISHTFFPGYAQKVQCRTDPRHRDRENPSDLLERLCDVGAAELLFPDPWFANDATSVQHAAGLVTLADAYGASKEATVRRFAETHPRCLAAVFFTWKLTPTQERRIGGKGQTSLFGIDPQEEVRAARKLRIDYAIASPSFTDAGHFLPKDKSIDAEGPIGQAVRGICADGEYWLDLAGAGGTYRIMAVPLYTSQGERGPDGEMAVAAILEPIAVKRPRKSSPQGGPSLFD